jgi:DNA-binding MarR family transcriptional regulator
MPVSTTPDDGHLATSARRPVDELIPAQMGLMIVQLGRAMGRRFTAAFAPIGIKPRQTAVLLELRSEGALSQQALGEILDIDPSNLVALLYDLEEQGLIVRRRDQHDRRRYLVEISDDGRERLGRVDQTSVDVESSFFAVLDNQERMVLHEMLARLVAAGDVPSLREVTAEVENDRAAQRSGRPPRRQTPGAK